MSWIIEPPRTPLAVAVEGIWAVLGHPGVVAIQREAESLTRSLNAGDRQPIWPEEFTRVAQRAVRR